MIITSPQNKTKQNAHEFGEVEMHKWWKDKDYLGYPGEVAVTADVSQELLVQQMIIQTVKNHV